MKTAIIPLAGKGVRLGKIGLAMAKALIPYRGHPAIDHILGALQAVDIESVILVVGWKKEGIISYLEDGSAFNIDIAYVIQPEPKGIADAIFRAKQFIKEEEFLVVLGDTILFPTDSLKILDDSNEVLVTRVDDPTKHGMVEYEGNIIKSVVEKPKSWDWNKGNLGICGAYRFNELIFNAIKNITPNQTSGELEISDAINKLITMGEEVRLRAFSGTYVDTGRILTNE